MAPEQEFNELYQRTYGFVADKARRMLRNDAEADDVAQEVYLRAWKHWPNVKRSPSKVGWLLLTASRLCLDRLRHRKVVEAHQAEDTRASDTEATTINRELLRKILGQTNELTQLIVVHIYADEMTQEETAALLGVSRKTVGRHLTQFRSQVGSEP